MDPEDDTNSEDEVGAQKQLDQPAEPTSTQLFLTVLGGIAAANGIAGLLMALAKWLSGLHNPSLSLFVGATFIVVPLMMGIVSAFVWRKLPLKTGSLLLLSLINTIVGLILAAVFFSEGVICLLMAAPLVWGFLLLGTLIGWQIVQPRTPKVLRVSVTPVLIGMLAIDCLASHGYERTVETRRVISAPPAKVFPHVVAFPKIDEPPSFWLCRIGLPAPEVVTVRGSRRDCIFTGNLIFQERITENVPGKRLTFEITHQPDHPEILGHAQVEKGQMELIDNRDGTTTLIGRSWYRLYVHPAWYFDRWAQGIGHAVHERVFDNIEKLSATVGTGS